MKKKSIIIISVIILLLLGFLFFNKPVNDNSSSVFRAIKTFFTGQVSTPDMAYENEESAYHDDPTVSDETNCCGSFVSTPDSPATVTEAEGRGLLKDGGVGINKLPPPTENSPNGTRIAGLPKNAIKAAIDIRSAFGQEITVTGGTEYGHKSHGCGKAIFDLRSDVALINWVKGKDKDPFVNRAGNKKYTFTVGGQSISCTFEEYPPFYKQARGRDNLPTSRLKKNMTHFPHLHCEVNLCVDPGTTKPNTSPQTNTIKK